jgi:hypothetical protein
MKFTRERSELTISNVSERLSVAESLEVSSSIEIEYLATHFYEADLHRVKSLSQSCLNEVLMSPKLQIRSEDSLLDIVLELGRDYFGFLGHVRSEYLSISGIDRLLNAISIDEVDAGLWLSLCRRLRLFVELPSIPESRFHLKPIDFDSSRPFDGIIASLTRECGGNVHTRGIVSITTTGNCRNRCYQVADYDWGDYWYGYDNSAAWIQFDFKDRLVSVRDYSIKSDGNAGCHLLRWKLEGSNDGDSWTLLDQRNTQDLNGSRVVKSYECEPSQSAVYRFVRLTQTGPNSSNDRHLMLSNIEFFGALSESQNQ